MKLYWLRIPRDIRRAAAETGISLDDVWHTYQSMSRRTDWNLWRAHVMMLNLMSDDVDMMHRHARHYFGRHGHKLTQINHESLKQ